MKKILLASLLSLVVISGKAQFLEGHAADQLVYGAEAVRISERTGHVQYIRFADPAPQSLAQLLEKRKPWMPAYNGAVTFEDQSSFEDAMGVTHTHKQMLVNGLPIEGGIVITHTLQGRLKALNGDLFQIKCPSTPVLTEVQALRRALDHVGARRYLWERGGLAQRFDTQNLAATPVGKLVYAPRDGHYQNGNFRLAWKFDIYAVEPLSRQYIFVDALTGEVIHTLNRIHTADVLGSAVTMYSGTLPVTADQQSANLFRLRETGRGGGIITRNCQTGTSYAAAVDFTDTDNNWNNVNAAQDQCGPDAHIGTEATYDYYNLVHNWHSYDNLNSPLLSYVHYDVQFGNAFWDGTEMTYGDGDGGTFSGPLTTFDVCGHEITHGVTEHTAALVYADESGALNESFSDCFGKALEHRMTPGVFSWLVGKQCTVGQIGIRDMADPTVFQNPGCYNGQYWVPGADVHYNSGVQNHWFFMMVAGDAGVNDLGNAYNIVGLGWTKTEAIAFRNLSTYLTPSSDYADARFYAIQSASDLYGACSTEMITTANAWYAVGVGGPWTNTPLAAFQASPHNFCAAPATVNFINNSNSGATFKWYFGDGGTSTLANPTHTYNALGSYNVKLVVTSCNGSKDSLTQNNYVILDTNIACSVTLPQSGNTLVSYCTGSLLDPGGLGDYQDNTNTVVTISPAGAAYIVLTFNMFDLESGFDFLNVYDGPTVGSPLIGSYTGSALPNGGSISSTNGSITLEFTTDVSVVRPGFDIGFECFSPTVAPTANFTALPLLTCDGFVTFNDASTEHPSTWAWTFGDGGTSTAQNPMHQYLTPGTYTVTMQACNSIGCNTYTCVNCVTYDPNATACSITVLPTSGITNLYACSGLLYDDGGLGAYSDNVNTTAIFQPPGATLVQLYFSVFEIESGFDYVMIYDGAGTSGPLLGTFTGTALPNGGAPFVSSGGALTMVFTSDPSVTYQGFEAHWLSTGATSGPTAQFTAPTSGSIGQVLNFTDQSTNGTTWSWDFGDFGTSTLQNPTHAYAANGIYQVTLRVTNGSGCDDNYSQTVYIGVTAAGAPTNMSLDLWPNPAHDQVQLKLRLPATTDLQLKVTDALGQVVYQETASAVDGLQRILDLGKLSKGLYFVKIETAQGQLVRKLVMD